MTRPSHFVTTALSKHLYLARQYHALAGVKVYIGGQGTNSGSRYPDRKVLVSSSSLGKP